MQSWKDKNISDLDKEKLKKNMPTYVILLLALGAMTFFGVCDPTSASRGPRGSAAAVEGEVISRNEFERAYRGRYDQYQRQFGDQFDPAALQLARSVMKELVDDRILYLKATDLGLRASDEEVITLLQREDAFKGEGGKFSEEVFEGYLKNQGYTEASFLEEIRRSVTVAKFRRFVTDTTYVSSKAAELDYKLAETKLDVEYLKFDPQKVEVKPTTEEVDKFLADEAGKGKVKEYFDANTKEFNSPEQLRARHILIQFEGARNATPEAAKRKKDDARKIADEVAAAAKAPGADFAKLATEKTDEAAGKAKGGDLGLFTRETMVKEFSDAAFVMNPGDVSGVVESPFGFHVIKVEEKVAAVTTKLEDAQRKIAENLLVKERRPKVAKEQADKVLAELNNKQPATALLTDYKTEWAATGEVAANSRYLPGIGQSKEVSDAMAVLTTVGQVYPQVLDVRGNYYVLRLKAKKDADMAKFDGDKKKELTQSAAFSDGYALYSLYEKQLRDEMEKKKKIWMNPEYLALDDRKAEANPGS